MRVWILTSDHINDLQEQSIGEAVKRCKAAHHTDLDIRINGKNEHHQADWVKHLVEIPAEHATMAIMAAQLAQARETIARWHEWHIANRQLEAAGQQQSESQSGCRDAK